MADVVNSMSMPDGATTTSPRPGAPAPNRGQSWPPGQHDKLKLPSGKTIGETDNETLRRELIRLDVEDAATVGRHILAERYSSMLQKIHP
jgi:hypothetical protein